MTQALEGIRILDFTRQLSGPLATATMSDFGAQVIKVEALPGGDGSRTTGADYIDDESALFLAWNRGKRSFAVNLHESEGLNLVKQLADQADVVIENYRPGVAEKIGIGYEQLSATNPGLVYVSITAFGKGPLEQFAGTDPVVQAMSGVMSVTGEPDRGPALVGVPIADYSAALLGGQAIMLGLLARERTGKGQKIDVSMLSGLIASLTTRIANHWATGKDPGRHGSSHSVNVPYQAFKTSDGHAVAGVWGAKGWDNFCHAIERPEMIDDPRYATNIERVRHREEVTRLIEEKMMHRTTEEWEKIFHEYDVLFSPVLTFSQTLAHPQVVGSGIIQEVEHKRLGPIKQVGSAISMSDTPPAIQSPPPVLGEHTAEILGELGLDAGSVRDLESRGVVQLDG